MNKARLITLFFLLLLVPSVCARNISILPNKLGAHFAESTITGLVTDDAGRLWVGTQSGLFVFDGDRMREVFLPVEQGATDLRVNISEMHQSESGSIWALSNGSDLLNIDTASRTISMIESINHREKSMVEGILSTRNGDVWVYGKNILTVYSSRFRTFLDIHSDLHPDITKNHFLAIREQADGTLVCATSRSIIELSGTTKAGYFDFKMNKIQFNADSEVGLAFKLKEDGGIITITNTGSIYEIEAPTWKVRMIDDTLISRKINVSGIDSLRDTIFIASDQGLWIKNPEDDELSSLTTSNSNLSNDHITALYAFENFMWVGTFEGLNVISESIFELYDDKNSGIDNEVLTFAENDSGDVWVGTYSGLYLFDKESNRHMSLKDAYPNLDISDNRVVSLEVDDHLIWVGFRDNGLEVIDSLIGKGGVYREQLKELDGLTITKILKGNDGSIWIATLQDSAYRFIEGRLERISLPTKRITIMEVYSDNLAVFGNEESIHIFLSGERFDVERRLLEGVYSGSFLVFEIIDTDTFIIGTQNTGLLIGEIDLERKSISDIRRVDLDYVLHLSIYGIVIDKAKSIWLSTSDGIIRTNSKLQESVRFSLRDGLQGRDFNFGAAMIDTENILYFGGSNGYNRIKASHLQPIIRIPNMILNSVIVNGKEVYTSANESLTVKFLRKSENITLTYSAIDYFETFSSRYRHRLLGFDSSWINAGPNNSQTYTNLPPGTYTFHAQGADSSGVWNEEGIKIEITVLPPWYLTWWAYSLYALAGLTFLLIFKKWYDTHLMKEHALALADEMSLAADLAMDDLQEQLDEQDRLAHTMHLRNHDLLKLIKDIAERLQLSDSRSAESRLISTIDALGILENSLQYHEYEVQANLRRYTNDLLARLMDGIRINDGPEISTIVEVTELPVQAGPAARIAVLIHELVENALTQAFTPGSIGNFLSIVFSPPGDNDDSAGRWSLRFYHNGDGASVFPAAGTGNDYQVSLIRAMVEDLNADVQLDSDTGQSVALFFYLSNSDELS